MLMTSLSKPRGSAIWLTTSTLSSSALRQKNIKLNLNKCVFGVPRGMLLGFIISERDIKANPEKIAAINKMDPIHDLKGIQRVTGYLAALSASFRTLAKRRSH
jgi:hypothetical protein